MSEEQNNQQAIQANPESGVAPISNVAQMPVQPTAVQVPQEAQRALESAQQGNPVPTPMPSPKPVQIDRLAHSEDYVYKDANGYEWHYKFQFPGVRKAYEMLDNAKMANGVISNSILYDEYCQSVIIDPAHLSIDDFDNRPGLEEVMDAADSFLGKWLS